MNSLGILALASCVLAFAQGIFAQQSVGHPSVSGNPFTTGVVEGRIVDPDGLGVTGVTVRLEGRSLPAALEAVSSVPDGRFRFERVPGPAAYTLTTSPLGAYQAARVTVALTSAQRAAVEIRPRLGFSEEVTVTDTRERRLKRETAATVDSVTRESIDDIKPTHPSQVMSRVPGVWVNTTGGEGHMTAIRQPLTSSPVYLYLEDGVPTRSTGFFNHNALYEVNIPGAEGIEVTKGPASALYGSDAIGGVVNVLTRPALGRPAASADIEGGSFGWRRLLAGGNASRGTKGLRADVNVTHSDGWRDATGYNRQGGTVRWDMATAGVASWKTVMAFNHIDQQTAGTSTLQEAEYLSNPQWNLTPISYRRVKAFRLSTDYERVQGSTLWSVIPYFRYDTMALLANWSLPYDPTAYDTRNISYGVLAKFRRDFAPMRAQVISGFDLDLSPGGRVENQITPGTTLTPNGKRVFSSYSPGPTIYDYHVTFLSASPYAQVDLSPASRLRASVGVRVDRMGYDYADRLDTPASTRYRRPSDTSRAYAHASPKVGVTFQVSNRVNVFAAYRNAFRAPSEGQLFRQGSTVDTVDLRPVKADNYEVGLRASLPNHANFELSLYRLEKRDDILSYRDPLDGMTHQLNAGRTRHNGVEMGADFAPVSWFRASANYAYARHTYADWVLDRRQAVGADYTGKDMETGPRHMGNVLLSVSPKHGIKGSLEVARLGSYWMDAANTTQYNGHTLLNLRADVSVGRGAHVFARALNLADRRYAESTSYTIQRGRELAPGMPRTLCLGLSLGWAK